MPTELAACSKLEGRNILDPNFLRYNRGFIRRIYTRRLGWLYRFGSASPVGISTECSIGSRFRLCRSNVFPVQPLPRRIYSGRRPFEMGCITPQPKLCAGLYLNLFSGSVGIEACRNQIFRVDVMRALSQELYFGRLSLNFPEFDANTILSIDIRERPENLFR